MAVISLSDLVPGDLLADPSPFDDLDWVVLVAIHQPHPLHRQQVLVVWRYSDDVNGASRYGFDALDATQVIPGHLIPPTSLSSRRDRLSWALGKYGFNQPGV